MSLRALTGFTSMKICSNGIPFVSMILIKNKFIEKKRGEQFPLPFLTITTGKYYKKNSLQEFLVKYIILAASDYYLHNQQSLTIPFAHVKSRDV